MEEVHRVCVGGYYKRPGQQSGVPSDEGVVSRFVDAEEKRSLFYGDLMIKIMMMRRGVLMARLRWRPQFSNWLDHIGRRPLCVCLSACCIRKPHPNRVNDCEANRAIFAGTTSGVKESMYRIGFVVVDRRHPIIVSAAIKCAEPSNFTLFVCVDRPVLHLATYRIGWAELNTLDYSAQLWKILPGKIAP